MKLNKEQISALAHIAAHLKTIAAQFNSLFKTIDELLTNNEPENQLNMFEETSKPISPETKLDFVPIKFTFAEDLGKDILNGKYDNALFVPIKGSNDAAAYDLRAYIPFDTTRMIPGYMYLAPGETRIISTNLKVEVAPGYELNIYSRSGLASKGIIVANAPGIVDSDYRGVVGVILHNQSNQEFKIEHGDRIAQCEVHKCLQIDWKKAEKLEDTERGEGGFNSTGVK